MRLDFGFILKRAFEITKDNKVLWVFGIIIAFFGGAGNTPNFNSSVSDNKNFDIPKIDFEQILPLLIIVVIAAIILAIAAVFLSALSRGALVHLVDKVDKGEAISVREGFKAGFSVALPLILISLVIGIPLFFLISLSVAILLGPGILLLVVVESKVIGVLLIVIGGLVCMALVIAAAVAVTIVLLYAERYYVLTGSKVIESIKMAITLFRGNVGQSLLLWLINVGISIGSGLITLIIVLVFGLPIVLLAIAVSLWVLVLLIIPIAAIAFVGGLFQVYFSSMWTLAFKQLENVKREA